MINNTVKKLALLSITTTLVACAQTGIKTGGSSNLVSGAASGESSVNANKALEHCTSPLGTLAVSDGRISGSSTVTTVDPLIRLAIQQSNCFVITGIANQATSATLNHITSQQRDGDYRAGSNQQKGQRVAADYLLEPHVIVNNETTSGTSGNLVGAVAGAFGGPLLSAAVGGLSAMSATKTTDVALTLTDIRSTVQIGMSQGSATATNSGLSGAAGGWGGFLGGVAGGGFGMSSFTQTPEGQATAAAFFDAYNNLVISLRSYKAQDVKGGMGTGGQLKVN